MIQGSILFPLMHKKLINFKIPLAVNPDSKNKLNNNPVKYQIKQTNNPRVDLETISLSITILWLIFLEFVERISIDY